MWGIVPAAEKGTGIQSLAFSKELLPVGSQYDGHTERPRAVSEYLVERMILAGAEKICIVISPGKTDIMEYYGGGVGSAHVCYTVQQHPHGFCDAIFRALPLIDPKETVVVGLPDTVWFPLDGFRALPEDAFSFLLFPVEHPEFFDVVRTAPDGMVREIIVKQPGMGERWIWGAFRLPGTVFHELYRLWNERERVDEYWGPLVNAYIVRGGMVMGIRAGISYVDIGVANGYQDAIQLLSRARRMEPSPDENAGIPGIVTA